MTIKISLNENTKVETIKNFMDLISCLNFVNVVFIDSEVYEENNNHCIDCKYFIPGNNFSPKCYNCDNGSNYDYKK